MTTLTSAGEKSTKIKNDLLVANFQLELIDEAFAGSDMRTLAATTNAVVDIPKAIAQNVQIYSANREVILKTRKDFENCRDEMPNWDQYVQANPDKNIKQLDTSYNVKYRTFLKSAEEASEMAKLFPLMDRLAEKITRVIQRAKALKLVDSNLSVQKMPSANISHQLLLRQEP